jgi:hypothetical protein
MSAAAAASGNRTFIGVKVGRREFRMCIWRAANLTLKRCGAKALAESAVRADETRRYWRSRRRGGLAPDLCHCTRCRT